MECMEVREAEWIEGLWDNALPESIPMISRHKIFSLSWKETFAWAGM